MKKKKITKKITKEVAIRIKDVSKMYTLHHEKPTLVQQFLHHSSKEKYLALKKISLNIYTGQKIGIIGKNGSGKTTLLKVISGITTQTSGIVEVKKRLVSLIDVAAGFHPELTGEENIMLNGLLIGMSKKEVKEKMERIIEFADIHQFIDAPFFTYSEGMKLRLGFSIAVHSDPEILIIDESILAGDLNFREKLEKKIQEFFFANKTIIVVTQWLEFLEKNCQRIIWIEDGKIVADGGKKIIKKFLFAD
jgi:ABC-type polysaccharide/polyol phosphate transport system ATPase subunit